MGQGFSKQFFYEMILHVSYDAHQILQNQSCYFSYNNKYYITLFTKSQVFCIVLYPVDPVVLLLYTSRSGIRTYKVYTYKHN